MKFEIKNMARIERAYIELKPLTVFIGKNGTNKSYMAHLVYELYKEINNFEEPLFMKDSKVTRNIIASFINKYKEELGKSFNFAIIDESYIIDKLQVDIDEYEDMEYVIYIYSIDKLKNDGILDKIYNFVIESLVLKINKSYNTKNKVLEYIRFEEEIENVFTEDIKIKINVERRENTIFINQQLIRILFNKIFKFFKQKLNLDSFFYFPSSRTGFVLAFDEIVSGVFRDRFGGRPTATKLTIPTIDFLSNFADIKTGKFQDENNDFNFFINNSFENKLPEEILNYLEKYILKGSILENETEEEYLNYSLKTLDGLVLDLHLTSTATLELLPLVVFLRHFSSIKNRLLVIEEPEAHLHPKAQILMARFLVLLINHGAKIVITTHSDYIIQELNNCIKLFNQKPDIIEQYNFDDGMGSSIYLNEEDLSVYLFKEEGEKVKVINLEIEDEEGISLDSFRNIEIEVN